MVAASTALLVVALRTIPWVHAGGASVEEREALKPQIDTSDRIHAILAAHAEGFSREEVLDLASTVEDVSELHGLDPYLVLAVIRVESTFRRNQKSPAGALGLMQVMPPTGRQYAKRLKVPWKGDHTLFDAESNVRIGAGYLAWLLKRFNGDVTHALTAYNHGPTRVRRILNKDGKLPSWRLDYGRAVKAAWRKYRPAKKKGPVS